MASEQREDEIPEAPWERIVREDLATWPEIMKQTSKRPWDEKDDLWLEIITGKATPKHAPAPRNLDL